MKPYKNFYNFGNLKIIKRADHSLEMARLGLFCNYGFINQIRKYD